MDGECSEPKVGKVRFDNRGDPEQVRKVTSRAPGKRLK